MQGRPCNPTAITRQSLRRAQRKIIPALRKPRGDNEAGHGFPQGPSQAERGIWPCRKPKEMRSAYCGKKWITLPAVMTALS